ncbi:amidase [Kiloniella sp. b19]|uniref:amidase n=1 Tax=Kiloniella sp. GXU_MW_B19 TaxID=3141326 RepID=UPI0031CDE275
MFDSLGAFVPNGNMTFEGAGEGPLRGYGFAVKDIFDLKGYVTGYGNPDWASRRRPSKEHARVVADLLAAGAMVVGKTITDEFAYSLNGQNLHYGTPANPEAPGRIPGGSSSGSASAVSGGLVDFALGSDTGGSIRVPGSYCGLFGIRTTHDRISREGVLPLAGSFDTVGWFARDAWMLELVGRVLSGLDAGQQVEAAPSQLLVAEDAFELLDENVRRAFAPHLERLEQRLGRAVRVRLADGLQDLAEGADLFRTVQAYEIWQAYGDWMSRVKPKIAEDIQQRLDWASSVTQTQMEEAQAKREHYARGLRLKLGGGAVLALPSAPGIAPMMNAKAEDLAQYRMDLLALTSPAGLTGLPQVTMPLASFQGCPLGLSLMGGADSDEKLMAFVRSFAGGEDSAGEAAPLMPF